MTEIKKKIKGFIFAPAHGTVTPRRGLKVRISITFSVKICKIIRVEVKGTLAQLSKVPKKVNNYS